MTTETKHTPAPWMAHHDHGWLVVESACGELYIKIEKGSCATKHIANARLIAAAPELLEALSLIVDSADKNQAAIINAFLVAAKKAIAKATGETQ